MDFHLAQPSDLLSTFVKSYWGMENHMPAGETHKQRIIPCGLTDLTFYLGDLPQSLDENKQFPEPSMLTGQQKSHYDIQVQGRVSLFSVTFRPIGLMLFFNLPARELFDQIVPLHLLMKDETHELEDRLSDAGSFLARKSVIENFLVKRLSQSRENHEQGRISHSIGIINRARGDVEIEQLASASCLSRKQYERTFLTHVGATPKLFLRTVRFQHAIHRKSLQKSLSLTELSHRCAYYDQSHMTSDFQKLSGMSPRKFFADCNPYSDYFQ